MIYDNRDRFHIKKHRNFKSVLNFYVYEVSQLDKRCKTFKNFYVL